MASGLINTLPRSSCGKCVGVLKELIAGLDELDNDTNDGNSPNNSNSHGNKDEPPPLTLLRAIARSSEDHPWHDRWGQERTNLVESRHHHRLGQTPPNTPQTNDGPNENSNAHSISESISDAIRQSTRTTTTTIPNSTTAGGEHGHEQHQRRRPHPRLKIEETGDGLRLTIPVETTAPAFMKRWTQLEQPQRNVSIDDTSSDEVYEEWIPLATSVRRDDHEDPTTAGSIAKPLTIELKCRKCEASGPEAGARAFLMGPDPLSIVLCHNRIDSERTEVEEILTHELIHLYDVQTMKLDLSDCETVAYSEVRAAREAECHRSVRKAAAQARSEAGGLSTVTSQISESFDKHVYKPYCVRNIALGATQNMFPKRGRSCLNKVWETAYGDHRPFVRDEASPAGRNQDGRAPFDERNTNSGTIHGTSGK